MYPEPDDLSEMTDLAEGDRTATLAIVVIVALCAGCSLAFLVWACVAAVLS